MKKGLAFLFVMALLIQASDTLAVRKNRAVAWQDVPASVRSAAPADAQQQAVEMMIQKAQDNVDAIIDDTQAPTEDAQDSKDTPLATAQPDGQQTEPQEEAPPIPSEPEEYSDFEDPQPKVAEVKTQKKHNSAWKWFSDPGDPTNLIQILKAEDSIDTDYKMQYQNYVQTAIERLADQFNRSHNRREASSDVVSKRKICMENKNLTSQLIEIMELAQVLEIAIDPQIQAIAASWLVENKEAVAEYKLAAKQEEQSFLEVQDEDNVNKVLKLFTLKGKINRFARIKPESFRSCSSKKPQNMEKIMEISAQLRYELQKGTADLNDLEVFVVTCQEKDVPIDYDSLAELRLALIDNQDGNDEQFTHEASTRIAFDDTAERISQNLTDLIFERFITTQSVMMAGKHTPFVDFVRQFAMPEASDTDTDLATSLFEN